MVSLVVVVALSAAALGLQGCSGGPGGGSGVTCSTDGTDYKYEESVSGEVRSITTNHCPNHPWVSLNPNKPINDVLSYTIPSKPRFYGVPTESDQASAIKDLSQQGGGVGLFFSGAFMFSGYGGNRYGQTTNWETSAPYVEGNSFDQCGCHSSSSSQASYHCHQPPVCLMKQLGQTDAAHSPQLGWAYDGFPLYGPRGPGGVMMATCSSQSKTYMGDVCTDECGGYFNNADTIDNFVYRYYMQGQYGDGTSCDTPGCPGPTQEYHPTSPLCFRGCCPTGVTCERSMTACGDTGHADGYTGTYNASTSTIVNGKDMATGLAVNAGGCAGADLVCKETCTEQGWSGQKSCR